MHACLAKLDHLKRPRGRIHEPNFGTTKCDTHQILKRHTSRTFQPSNGAELLYRFSLKIALEQQRRPGAAAYSAVKHVDLAIAMQSEAHLLRASQSQLL
ncbi:DUF6477 family protein [Shimia sp.]|uniref:DUF6477 family protein n=1 Tax=Shimia sp. TaxID=1954381 RepID=UPI003BAC18D1